MKLKTLIRKAREATAFRGHDMRRFKMITPDLASSTCRVCGKYVQVNTRPMPNGIDIGGEAVALGCND